MTDRAAWTQALGQAETTEQVCRVPGCVAFAVWPRGVVDVLYATCICIGHQQLDAAELRLLLKRGTGVPTLRPIAVGIEYERADGSQYGIDHSGNYYDVRGPR